MPRVDVVMPQMGESIAEGTVSKWLKQVGESVKRDEAMLEISTDKVDAEIPAPASGVLVEIKVPEGETVEVQTVIAVIDTDGSGPVAVPDKQETKAPAEVAKEPQLTETSPPPPSPAPRGGGEGGEEERLRTRSTPLVRKIAADHGVDLAAVSGTGTAGRVTKKDILAFIESGAVTAATRAPDQPAPAQPAGASIRPTVEAWPGDRVEPMSKIRRLTADHMVMSRRTSAHVTSFYEIDFTWIAKLRTSRKADYLERGVKLTYMGFITKAVADNLARHPVLNASVSGDSIIYRKPINIGIAVALDWGLIVPVLKNADELSALGISRQLADLAERARTKRLSPDEVQQGTFTITNPGGFGSYVGAPIINQPQVAILGVGAIEKRPKVLTLEDGQDVIAIRTMCMFSLSYDHRIVDGVDADRFMADLKRDLEQFSEGAL